MISECMSRQLVVIRSLSLVVDPLRQYVIKMLEDNLKKYAPHIQTVKPAKNLRKALEKDFKKTNLSEAKIKNLIAVHGSKFRFDAFTYAHFFLPEHDTKNGKSFNEIDDPKVYLDILINVPHVDTYNIVGYAKTLAEFRNTTNNNEFIKCTDEATSTFFHVLKKLTQQIVDGAKADEIVRDIEKWEGRKLTFMPQNLKKLEDNQMIKEVIDAWQPIRENDGEMSEMNEKIVQLQECVDQKLREHDSKLDEHDLKLGEHDSNIATLYSLTAEHASKFDELQRTCSPITTCETISEESENIDVAAIKLEKDLGDVGAAPKEQTAKFSTHHDETKPRPVTLSSCRIGDNCEMNIGSGGGSAHVAVTANTPIGHKHKKICAKNIGKNWREFGRHEEVNFTEGQMDNIEADTNTQYERIYKLIHDWHSKLGSKANTPLLATILEEIDMRDVAEKVLLA
ncbi:unnamed protein product [Owenia fusiformis]|uniref:Uncharacterized protein n=1 Tax=Owenia fusiformis TaxID=6347 RepID=A0A8J1TWC6_OWEFU|nr:unnamed protein product [Owenia fusiformis]